MKIKYVAAGNIENLEYQVNKYLKEGWSLYRGIVKVHTSVFVQTIVIQENINNEEFKKLYDFYKKDLEINGY